LALFGQQAPTPQEAQTPNSADEVKRITPVPNKPPSKVDTFVEHFDFGANVQALERSMEDVPGSPPSTPPSPGAQKGEATMTLPVSTGSPCVPPGCNPPTDVTLSTTKPIDKAAVARRWPRGLRISRCWIWTNPSIVSLRGFAQRTRDAIRRSSLPISLFVD
jgi:hypothetical protein